VDAFVRRCENCDAIDRRETWSSVEEATEAGAFEKPWTCGTCAWSEFDLVESSPEAARTT
jgi:hypothetical protein